MRRILLFLAASVVALPLAAQNTVPKRPKLPKNLDTLDARAYYEWGNRPNMDWKKRYAAFYWASRLEPDEFVYRVAIYFGLLYRQPPQWRSEYDRGAEYVVKSKEAREIDSVWASVIVRNPFPVRYTTCYLEEGLERNVDRLLVGVTHYNNGCYDRAEAAFAEALAKDSSQVGIHLRRAAALYHLHRYDQAVTETQIVIDTLRARDAKYLSRYYESKEMLEYSVGMIHYRAGELEAARQAFGRALAEDLSFYMAHARLGDIASLERRFQTAATEYGLAAELEPHDATMHYYQGQALVRMRFFEQAEAPLHEAIRLEPYWPQPYVELGLALEGEEKFADAVRAFEDFLVRCPRRFKRQADAVRAHLAADREKLAGGGGHPRQ